MILIKTKKNKIFKNDIAFLIKKARKTIIFFLVEKKVFFVLIKKFAKNKNKIQIFLFVFFHCLYYNFFAFQKK